MSFFKKKRVFLDYAAGRDNPSAIYKEGVEAKQRLEEARTRVARVLQVQAKEVIFTSGGTESDNLALLGVFAAAQKNIPQPHLVITSVEHPAILACAKEVERRGGEVTVVEAVDGVINVESVMAAVKENTILVSIMYVNNETGAIQPISQIARRLAEERKKNNSTYPFFHTDASQAAGVLPIQFSTLGVDLMTLEGSKLGASKGAGVLIVRHRVSIEAVQFGGGQERDLRAGTENVSAIVDFAYALEQAEQIRSQEFARLTTLKNIFLQEIKNIPNLIINTPEDSAPHIVNLSFPGHLHEFLALKLDHEGVAVSTGSSCKSQVNGNEPEALRFSFGRETSESDVKTAARILGRIML